MPPPIHISARRGSTPLTDEQRAEAKRALRRRPESFADAMDEARQNIIDFNYRKLDERQKAIVDCARVACGRVKDLWAAAQVASEEFSAQLVEAVLIHERIKDLAPEVDWNGLGLMFDDDPRLHKGDS